MNVLLVYPNLLKEEGSPPLGVVSLATILKKNGFNVKIFDFSFNANYNDFEKEIISFKPNFVGISYITSYAGFAIKCSKIVKKINKKIKVIMGGPHPTLFPKETLRKKSVDYVIIGEGEETLLELIKNKKLNLIKGLYYKIKGKIIENKPKEYIKNLDKLPLPDWSLLPTFDKYLKYSKQMPIMISRGCPFHCSYCQPTLNKMFGKITRFRSPKRVVEELEYLTNKFNISNFVFHDDTFTLKKKWILDFCKILKKKKLNIRWKCNSRVGIIDDETLSAMKSVGLEKIAFGVESGSQRILEKILNKGIKIKQIIEAFEQCHKHKIDTTAFIMLGSPTETKRDIIKTINLVKKIKPGWVSVTRTVILPHTHLLDLAEKKKLSLVKKSDYTDFYYASFLSKTHRLSVTEGELYKLRGKLYYEWAKSTFFQKTLIKIAVMFISISSIYFPKLTRKIFSSLGKIFWIPPNLYA